MEIQNLQIHIKTLTADVYGLTVHGSEPADAKPLLQVPHISIGLKILSVLHHQVNLSELLIDHPVVNLVVDADGRSNLPQPPPSQKKSGSTNIFDLAIGHVLLTNGVINAADRQIPLNANLSGLRTEIGFSQLHQTYSGTISYQNGLIQYEHLRPLPHSLEASFSVDPSELNLKQLMLKLGGSQVQIEVAVRNYGSSTQSHRGITS